VTDPNDGDEVLYVNESFNITWNAVGTVTPVRIEYSTDGGGNWTIINNTYTGQDGQNSYEWFPNLSLNSEDCLIKVSDNRSAYIATVTDTSNNSFSIRPRINITEPIDNQNVVAHTNNTAIRWTYTGTSIDKVNVEYSTDGGGNWSTIQNNVEVENGTFYNWTPRVPDLTCDDNAVIRVYDVDNENVTNQTETFNIVGGLILDGPVGGENFKILGTTNYITWTAYAINQINITYSPNNGQDWYEVSSFETASNESYLWNISNETSVSNEALVRLQDTSNEDIVNVTSPSTFAIIAVFDILHPELGDPVYANESYTINWTTDKSQGVGNVTLEYTTDGGNWSNVTNTSVPNTGSYPWDVPNDIPLTETCKIRIRDENNANASNLSQSYFYTQGKINVTEPDGGESWQIYTAHDINWTIQGLIGNVTILLSTDGGGNYTTTISPKELASNGTYNWYINTSVSSSPQAKIKVASYQNPDVTYNESNGTFFIKGDINITDPNDPGIVMTYDNGSSTHNITWETFGNISQVQLRYTTDHTNSTYNYTIDNVTAPNTTYEWTIPDKIGVNLGVQVRDYNDSTVNASSANPFAIKGSIHLDTPNGGGAILKGSSYNVTWEVPIMSPGLLQEPILVM